MTDGLRALELLDLMKNSSGQAIQNELEMLGWSTHTLQGNIRQLTTYVRHASSDRSLAWMRNRDKLEFVQREIARYLHNSVAAVATLVDHTRVVSRRLYRDHPSHMDEYQRRVDSLFKKDPLIQFVQGLRDYCLHYGFPFVGRSLSEVEGQIKQAFFLNRTLLLNGFDWKSIARAHLQNLDDRIDFVVLMEEYEASVGHFYQWFEADIRSLYREALDEVAEYRREYHLIHLQEFADDWGNYGTQPDLPIDTRLENLFLGMLSSATLDKMAAIRDPREKMELVLGVLDKSLQIPDSLKARLREFVTDDQGR